MSAEDKAGVSKLLVTPARDADVKFSPGGVYVPSYLPSHLQDRTAETKEKEKPSHRSEDGPVFEVAGYSTQQSNTSSSASYLTNSVQQSAGSQQSNRAGPGSYQTIPRTDPATYTGQYATPTTRIGPSFQKYYGPTTVSSTSTDRKDHPIPTTGGLTHSVPGTASSTRGIPYQPSSFGSQFAKNTTSSSQHYVYNQVSTSSGLPNRQSNPLHPAGSYVPFSATTQYLQYSPQSSTESRSAYSNSGPKAPEAGQLASKGPAETAGGASPSAYKESAQSSLPHPHSKVVLSPKDSLRLSSNNQPRQVSQIVHPPVKLSEVVIEHPPIVKGIFERQSVAYTNVKVPETQSVDYIFGPPQVSTNITSLSERAVKSDSQANSHSEYSEDLQRQRERNDELLMHLQRIEGQDKDTIHQLRRSLEALQARVQELEDKYRKAIHERDELTYKLESRADTNSHLRDRLAELEAECKSIRQKLQKADGDNSILQAEKSDLEVQLRKLNAELSSKQFSQDFLASEASNRLLISEEKNRHLEKRILDFEDEIAHLSRDYKEYREKASLTQLQHLQHSNSEKTVTRVVQSGATESEVHSLTSPLYAQLKDKNIQLEELRHKVDSLESKLRQADKSCSEISSQLDAERIKHASTASLRESDKKSAASKIEELAKKLEESTSDCREEKDKAASHAREIDSLKSKLRQVEDELEVTRKERAGLLSDRKSLESKGAAKDTEVAKLQRLLDAKTSECQLLDSDLAAKSAKLTQAQKTISDLEKEVAEHKQSLKSLESSNSRLERDMESMVSKATVKELTNEIETLQEGLRVLEDKAVSREEELLQEIEHNHKSIEELEAKTEVLNEQLQETEQKLQTSLGEQDKIREYCDKFICDNSTLDKAVRQLSAEVESLRQLCYEQQLEVQAASVSQLQQDETLSDQITHQLRRLIDLNRSKDLEIGQLSEKLEAAVKVSEERLLLVQNAQLDNARLLNEAAELYQMLETAGITKKLREGEGGAQPTRN